MPPTQGSHSPGNLEFDIKFTILPFCDDLYRPRLKNSVDDFSEDGNAIVNSNDL